MAAAVDEFVTINVFLCIVYEAKDPEHSFAKAFSRMHSFNVERTLKMHMFLEIECDAAKAWTTNLELPVPFG